MIVSYVIAFKDIFYLTFIFFQWFWEHISPLSPQIAPIVVCYRLMNFFYRVNERFAKMKCFLELLYKKTIKFIEWLKAYIKVSNIIYQYL